MELSADGVRWTGATFIYYLLISYLLVQEIFNEKAPEVNEGSAVAAAFPDPQYCRRSVDIAPILLLHTRAWACSIGPCKATWDQAGSL